MQTRVASIFAAAVLAYATVSAADPPDDAADRARPGAAPRAVDTICESVAGAATRCRAAAALYRDREAPRETDAPRPRGTADAPSRAAH